MSATKLPFLRRTTRSLMPAVLVGCSASSDRAEPRTVVYDSAGMQIIENPKEGALGPGPLGLAETRRIGVVEGTEPYQFYRVRGVLVDEEGTGSSGWTTQSGSLDGPLRQLYFRRAD